MDYNRMWILLAVLSAIVIGATAQGRGFSISMEPRYNLATKVMSNGVEVIVAGPRGQRPGSSIEPDFLRLLSSTVTRPITLAPHTLSRHMSMLLPSKLQFGDNMISSLDPKDELATRTRYTTISFPRTTVNKNMVSMTVDTTVITNLEEIHADVRPTTIHKKISLSASPVLQTNVHRTVFTHLYTVLDDDQPVVATSQHTITNTKIAFDDHNYLLEPSEIFPMSHTYLSTREFTKTLTDGTDFQVVSTTDVVTEVIVTDPPETETHVGSPPTVDVTKTYFVTYTYYKTLLEGNETKVSSDVSVSSDVTVEKFLVKTKSPTLPNADEQTNPIAEALIEDENLISPTDNDVVDEWYEKFKIKSTTETDLTRTKFKTKTVSKSKIKPTKSFVVTPTTPPVINTIPSDQSNLNNTKVKNATESMSALESLGLNGMKVWGPVFNAMKDFLKKNNKEPVKRKNDTVAMSPKNPVIEGKHPKTTTQRIPLYIPVGSFADSETGESNDRVAILPHPQKWMQDKPPSKFYDKNNNTPIPILEGGIPISPGQVITTNSDVIIGRPSDSGPRPPHLAVKDNVPIDMKPPPIEEPVVHHIEPVGQFSTNQAIVPEKTILKPVHNHHYQKNPRPIHHPIDDGSIDLNPPPPPPQHVVVQQHHGPPSSPIPIPVHLQPNEIIENYVNPVHLIPDNPALGNNISPSPTPPLSHKISKIIDRSNLLVNIQPSQVAQVMIPHGSSTAVIIQDEPQTKGEVIDDPKPHPEPETVGFVKTEPVLKVEPENIQGARPKPDYNNIGMMPPEPSSGIFVDVSPPGHIPVPPLHSENLENHQSGIVHDVPLNVQVQLGSSSRNDTIIDHLSPPPPPRTSSPTQTNNKNNNYRIPQPADFMLPPPRPAYPHPMPIPIGAANLEQHYHPGEVLIGQPSDYTNDEDADLKTEDGEEIQESNSRPLLPGQVPHELATTPRADEEMAVFNDNEKSDRDNTTFRMEIESTTMFSTEKPMDRPMMNVSKPEEINEIFKPHFEEVMGLSPPPMELPRPPPPRQKPPFPFEIPTTTKIPLTLIELENDFPPVRTPEMIKKPFKPEDIFPPRLPENFVHHEIIPPKHRKPVTSLPIDIPTESPTNSSSITKPNFIERPKPIRPPTRGPPPKYHETPIRKPFDSSQRGQTKYEHYRPGDNIFGEKVPNYPSENQTPPPSPPRKEYQPPPRPNDNFPSAFEQPPPLKVTTFRPPMKHDFLKPPPFDGVPPSSFEEPSTTVSSLKPLDEPKRPIYPSRRPSIIYRRPIQKRPPMVETPPEIPINSPGPQFSVPEKLPNFSETTVRETYRPTPALETTTPEIVTAPITHSKSVQPNNIVTSIITSGSTTIFGDLYTDPILLQPSRVLASSQGVQFSFDGFGHGKGQGDSSLQNMLVVATPHIIPTHSTTLTVTSTLTTVVHAVGQNPTTRTILLTTTIISTIVDKVTETQTLLKPTTSTVTQTHTISTTKTALVVPTAIYPSRSPGLGKPEIFVTEPHDSHREGNVASSQPDNGNRKKVKITPAAAGSSNKPVIFVADPDMDTMTISVSSSMSKKGSSVQPPPVVHGDQEGSENESLLVTLTDKPPSPKKDAGLVLAGILTSQGSSKTTVTSECLPECRPSRNELCVKQEGAMKCICRPGFARMFPNHPCKPTYTYSMQMELSRMGNELIEFENGFQTPGSNKFVRMTSATKEGLTRMIMQSDLRDIYHGIAVTGFQPKNKKTQVDFNVQLSENVSEDKIVNVFKKSLRSSNYSLGGTEMVAARGSDNINIQDFNECENNKFHDCSENGRCFNMKGSYTCSCKEGFTDISENPQYPGRLCSDMIGCEFCSYHGTCFTRSEQTMCECFQWYTGDRCRINLKVLLIALVTIGAILLALLIAFLIISCIRRGGSRTSRTNASSGYLRYRGPTQSLDKRAMIMDTSSESSVENQQVPFHVNAPPVTSPPITAPATARKPVLRQTKRPAPQPQPLEQRDRSLTVMIPRVKYRAMPVPVATGVGGYPHQVTMSTFSPDRHLNRTQAQIAAEQKLIGLLDAPGPAGTQKSPKDDSKTINAANSSQKCFEYEYKTTNMNISDGTSSGERRSTGNKKDDRFRRYSDQTPLHGSLNNDANRLLQNRKHSTGALVSAGYAVSATGGIGLSLPIQDDELSTIRTNTLKSNRSQFTTLNRSGDHKTMSEARSYDETMIHPPTRALLTHYSGSTSSQHMGNNHDENHTMVERDLGSTFLMPESQLFKHAGDRGSDISNFDSL